MYAVIKTGGKQYRVSAGDRLRVESLVAEPGDEVTLDDVLMIGGEDVPNIGLPRIDGASVSARVVQQGRGNKIRIIKFQRRKHHRKQMGHRQNFTELEITGINTGRANDTAPQAD